MKTLEQTMRFAKKHKHLPTIIGRDEWNKKGRPSIGQLSTQLWQTVETQAIYIKELKEMIDQQQQIIDQNQKRINAVVPQK